MVGGGGKEVTHGIAAYLAIVDVGAVGIEPGDVYPAGQGQQRVHAFMPQFARRQLVAQRQHHKRGVIGIGRKDLPKLPLIILPRRLALQRVHGIPVGKLRLHQHPQSVRRFKGGLRRAPGVKANKIHAVRLVGFHDLHPCPNVHRRMAGLRKHGAVGLAPQEQPSPVQRQLTRAIVSEPTDTEENLRRLKSLRGRCHFIKPDIPFIPRHDFLRE